MTDLCYNCGGCHLPRPCGRDLQTCETCGSMGHTWNFCHLGPKPREFDYKYFALCHNCDKWHLPEPCHREAIQCLICEQKGHLQFFCPIKPLARDWNQWTDSVPTKRARSPGLGDATQASHQLMDMSQRSSNSAGITPRQMLHSPGMMSEVYSLKMTVVKDVLDLVKAHPVESVYQYLSQAYAGYPRIQHQPMAPPQSIWPPTTQSRFEMQQSTTPTPQSFRHAVVDYEAPTRSTMGPRTTTPIGPRNAGSGAHDESGYGSRAKDETEQQPRTSLLTEPVDFDAPIPALKSEAPVAAPLQQSSGTHGTMYLQGSDLPISVTEAPGLVASTIATAGGQLMPAVPSQHGQEAIPATTTKRGGKKGAGTGTRAPRKSAATKLKEKQEKETKEATEKEQKEAQESREREMTAIR